MPHLQKLASLKTFVFKPSAIEVDEPAPDVEGLDAGTAVYSSEEKQLPMTITFALQLFMHTVLEKQSGKRRTKKSGHDFLLALAMLASYALLKVARKRLPTWLINFLTINNTTQMKVIHARSLIFYWLRWSFDIFFLISR